MKNSHSYHLDLGNFFINYLQNSRNKNIKLYIIRISLKRAIQGVRKIRVQRLTTDS